MNKEKIINYLKTSNTHLEETLLDDFTSERTITLLPIDVIKYCSLSKEAQESIIKMTNQEIKIFSMIIHYCKQLGQDWVSNSATFIRNRWC